MTISMNADRVEELARKIAARTGQAPGDVVEQALVEKLSRVESEPPKKKKATLEEIMEISRRASSRMSPEMRAMDIDDFLYDEHGLPK